MNVNITKIGNTIKCKNDYTIHYFNIYESYFKVENNNIFLYSTGSGTEKYIFGYNPLIDTVVYNPAPSLSLTTIEQHADYLAEVFFLVNSSSIGNIILNPFEYHIYENEFLSNYMNGNLNEGDRFDNDLAIGFSGNSGNIQLVVSNINNSKFNNGNFGQCINKTTAGNPSNSCMRRLLYNYTTVAYSDVSISKAHSNLSNETDKIVTTIIFSLLGNIWLTKTTGSNNASFYYGYKVFSNRNIAFDINNPSHGRFGLFALSYDTNSSINPTSNLRLHVLNNAPINLSIPISTFVNQYGRIDFVREYNSGNVKIDIYINSTLQYTYNYTTADLSNSLYVNSNVAPFFQVEQNGLGLQPSFGYLVDYILVAYNRYPNKKLIFYNNII